MNLQAFLTELYNREIQIWADGELLRCKAPSGVLTTTLREQLMERKNEILAFLRNAEAVAEQPRAIVPLQPLGTRPPVFGVGGHNGDVFTYRAFAQHLGEDQPFFGLEPPGLDGESEPLERVEDLAAYFAEQVVAFRPHGPYIISGYCAGGTVAYELARQLTQRGASIQFLALFAAPYPTFLGFSTQLSQGLVSNGRRVARHLRALTTGSYDEGRRYLMDMIRRRQMRFHAKRTTREDPVLLRRARVARVTSAAVARYDPGVYDGRVSLFLPNREWIHSRAEPLRWRAVAPRAEQYFGPDHCTPDNLLLEPDVPVLAALFRDCRDNGIQATQMAAS